MGANAEKWVISFKKEPLAHNFLFYTKRITVSVALETALK